MKHYKKSTKSIEEFAIHHYSLLKKFATVGPGHYCTVGLYVYNKVLGGQDKSWIPMRDKLSLFMF